MVNFNEVTDYYCLRHLRLNLALFRHSVVQYPRRNLNGWAFYLNLTLKTQVSGSIHVNIDGRT